MAGIFPEAPYVVSLCLLKETTLPKWNSKDWHIRSSGCLLPCSEGALPGKGSRASVSGGNGLALKSFCGANSIGAFYNYSHKSRLIKISSVDGVFCLPSFQCGSSLIICRPNHLKYLLQSNHNLSEKWRNMTLGRKMALP